MTNRTKWYQRLWPLQADNSLAPRTEVITGYEDITTPILAKPLKQKRKHVEYSLQCACVEHFDYFYPELSFLFFKVHNEGARSPKQGYQLKLMGKRAGVWDMFLSVPKQMPDNDWYHGAYYEFKPDEKSKLSHNQKLFGASAFNNRYCLEVITCKDQFVEHVSWYLSGDISR